MEAEERAVKFRKLDKSTSPNSEVSIAVETSTSASNSKNYTSASDKSPDVSDEPSLSYAVTPKFADIGVDGNEQEFQTSDEIADRALPENSLSKNQQKKLKRKQEWEANRTLRKAWRKEKIKEKKKRNRTAREEVSSESLPAANNHNLADKVEPPQKHARRRSTQLPITIILDCGFDDLMLDKERMSLAAQLTRCYSDTYKAPFKAHLAISSFGGHLKDRFDGVLAGHHLSWKGVRFLEEDFVEAAEQAKGWMSGPQGGVVDGALASRIDDGTIIESQVTPAGDVVYLTSDSLDTLTELKPYSTYIIGGLVDRNRHKGICYKKAMDRGVRTAKLPISEYMEMNSRFVLATNHVLEIMLKWLELGDWGETFLKVIPKRKGGVLKRIQSRQKSGNDQDGRREESSGALDDCEKITTSHQRV
ncbi:hypothetical protein MMC06_002067 [Schaereria dolodes]|nr:hypothetical protein [Schaereria dolodes]